MPPNRNSAKLHNNRAQLFVSDMVSNTLFHLQYFSPLGNPKRKFKKSDSFLQNHTSLPAFPEWEQSISCRTKEEVVMFRRGKIAYRNLPVRGFALRQW